MVKKISSQRRRYPETGTLVPGLRPLSVCGFRICRNII